jgi:hypothetical protein
MIGQEVQTGPYSPTEVNTGPDRPTQSHWGPYNLIQAQTGPYSPTEVQTISYLPRQAHAVPQRSRKSHTYRPIQSHRGPDNLIQANIVPQRSRQSHTDPDRSPCPAGFVSLGVWRQYQNLPNIFSQPRDSYRYFFLTLVEPHRGKFEPQKYPHRTSHWVTAFLTYTEWFLGVVQKVGNAPPRPPPPPQDEQTLDSTCIFRKNPWVQL